MESVVHGPPRRHAIWLLCLLLAACGDDDAGKASGLPAAPGDWQTVASSCGYRFRGPRDLVERPVQPIDSCVEVFESGDCRLTGDVGAYAPDLVPDSPDTTLVLWIACGSVAGRERLTPLLGTVELAPGAA